jgi:8-amino-7-oxononanoate synthase
MNEGHPPTRLAGIADATLASLRGQQQERRLRRIEGAADTHQNIGGNDSLLFCGSNYLDLAHHPEVIEAATRGARDWGCAAGGSRLINGNLGCHEQLEQELADYLGTEAALVLGPGYMANVGLIPAVVGSEDLIVSDALSHASLIDGCRLSGATVKVCAHNEPAAWKEILQQERSRYRRTLLVVDGLYSMDGDVAPLASYVELAEEFDSVLLVDDTHGTGTIGPGGQGSVAHCGVNPQRVDIQLGSLAKALGSYGSYIAGSQAMKDLLINTCRSFIFSCALPPPQVEAARAALRIMQAEPERREQLQQHGVYLRQQLAAHDIDTGLSTTHIVPVLIGDNDATMAACEALLQQGFFIQGIRYPSVPAGSARLRLTVMCSHQQTDIAALAAAIAAILGRDQRLASQGNSGS